MQAVAAGATGHQGRREKCALQKYRRRLGTDATVFTAHDARKSQGTLVVGNDQGALTQGNLGAVE